MIRTRRDRERANPGTPASYAQSILYLSCPTTVQAMTLREWGVKIPLQDITRWWQDKRRPRHGGRWDGRQIGNTEPDDRLDFKVRGTIKPSEIKPSKPEYGGPPLVALPEIQSDWRVLVKAIAEQFGFAFADIVGPNREAPLVTVRFLCSVILKERGNSLAQIGRWFGGRDHATIRHGVHAFPERAERDPKLMEVYRHFSPLWNEGVGG